MSGLTPAELLIIREGLGLGVDELGVLLGVQDRTIRRWHMGESPIPAGVEEQLREVTAEADRMVEAGVAEFILEHDPVVVVFRHDEALWASDPMFAAYPARFHRAIVARVAREVPALRVVFAE